MHGERSRSDSMSPVWAIELFCSEHCVCYFLCTNGTLSACNTVKGCFGLSLGHGKDASSVTCMFCQHLIQRLPSIARRFSANASVVGQHAMDGCQSIKRSIPRYSLTQQSHLLAGFSLFCFALWSRAVLCGSCLHRWLTFIQSGPDQECLSVLCCDRGVLHLRLLHHNCDWASCTVYRALTESGSGSGSGAGSGSNSGSDRPSSVCL